MNDNVLLGVWRHLVPIPRTLWRSQISKTAEHTGSRIDFMTEDHHRVRDLVVKEIAHRGMPLPPEWIAHQLELPIDRVVALLDEMDRAKTFLARNADGAVTWAYPVTTDRTPHRVTFSTGEQTYAA
jgi:hypothetical protein